MSKRYTVEEIAYQNEQAGGFYFSEATLKAWGQKLSDFEVYHVANRVFVYAKSGTSWSVGEFIPGTGRVVSVMGISDSVKLGAETTAGDIRSEIRKLASKEVA